MVYDHREETVLIKNNACYCSCMLIFTEVRELVGGGSILKVIFLKVSLVDCYCFYPDECASPVYYRKKKQKIGLTF